MNGGADLGGMMGFGPIGIEADEPLFHAPWERRAFAITLAMGATGSWTLDTSRFTRESLHPVDYLSSSYYEIWTKGLERLCFNAGLISLEELASGHASGPGKPLKRVLQAADVAAVLAKGSSVERPATAPAAFAIGDRVRARIRHPEGHTRLPRYLRGVSGTIEAIHGCHVFADDNAMGKGENPTWLYGVAFRGLDVWGADSDPTLVLRADLWEPHLERL